MPVPPSRAQSATKSSDHTRVVYGDPGPGGPDGGGGGGGGGRPGDVEDGGVVVRVAVVAAVVPPATVEAAGAAESRCTLTPRVGFALRPVAVTVRVCPAIFTRTDMRACGCSRPVTAVRASEPIRSRTRLDSVRGPPTTIETL